MTTQESFDIPAIRAALLAKLGSQADAYPQNAEVRFPRIVARINDLWGEPELDDYLDDLMISDREGRQGFPPEVAVELFRLIAVHGALRLGAAGRKRGWAIVDEVSIERRALDHNDGKAADESSQP